MCGRPDASVRPVSPGELQQRGLTTSHEQRGDVDPAQVLAEVLSQPSTQSCAARAETASAIEKAACRARSLIRVPIRRSTLKKSSRRP
jgi:hypothetical protein